MMGRWTQANTAPPPPKKRGWIYVFALGLAAFLGWKYLRPGDAPQSALPEEPPSR